MTQTQAAIKHDAHEISFDVAGMDCASCVAHVEKAARKIPGVQDVSVNLARGGRR
jgi:Cu+-exporting ATPase